MGPYNHVRSRGGVHLASQEESPCVAVLILVVQMLMFCGHSDMPILSRTYGLRGVVFCLKKLSQNRYLTPLGFIVNLFGMSLDSLASVLC
jgi:hypothetical protein